MSYKYNSEFSRSFSKPKAQRERWPDRGYDYEQTYQNPHFSGYNHSEDCLETPPPPPKWPRNIEEEKVITEDNRELTKGEFMSDYENSDFDDDDDGHDDDDGDVDNDIDSKFSTHEATNKNNDKMTKVYGMQNGNGMSKAARKKQRKKQLKAQKTVEKRALRKELRKDPAWRIMRKNENKEKRCSLAKRIFHLVDTNTVSGKICGNRSLFEVVWKETIRRANQIKSLTGILKEHTFVKDQFRLRIASEVDAAFLYYIVNQLLPPWENARFRLIQPMLSRRATVLFWSNCVTRSKSCGEILDILTNQNSGLCFDKWIIMNRKQTDIGEFMILHIDEDTAASYPERDIRLKFLQSSVKIKICGKCNKQKGFTLGEKRVGRSNT